MPLLRFIDLLEQALGREAIRDLQPIQPGDVPSTPIETGVARFASWYRDYTGA